MLLFITPGFLKSFGINNFIDIIHKIKIPLPIKNGRGISQILRLNNLFSFNLPYISPIIGNTTKNS
jgi:hypothetical protein